jgi:hypothetical protein
VTERKKKLLEREGKDGRKRKESEDVLKEE